MAICYGWVSAEFVGNSLILTDARGNTLDINLVLAECRIIGEGYVVSSVKTSSGFIPDSNQLQGVGNPLSYAEVRAAITAATA